MMSASSFSPLLSLPRVSKTRRSRSSILANSSRVPSAAAAPSTNKFVASTPPAATAGSSIAPLHLLSSCCFDDALCHFPARYGTRKSPVTVAPVSINQLNNIRRKNVRFPSASASPICDTQATKGVSISDLCQKVCLAAREKFIQEISFQSMDKNISLAKALLYIAAEDEAFMAFQKKMEDHPISDEQIDVSSDNHEVHCLDAMLLAGRSLSEWLAELDVITREVEAELVSRDIGCHLVEVLEAVNVVLFKLRGFKRVPIAVDPKFSYLHGVLCSGRGSAVLLSIIYIEVCRRLGLTIIGSRVGEDFLIWPKTESPEELFKVTSNGHSLFAIVNGGCVEDPRSMASDLNSASLSALDITTNRDIIGIALANLIRLHWKRASRMNHGLMLTSALRPVHYSGRTSNHPILQPQELRLAMMASERLLILQPHKWSLRRDYGMMLYYNKEYGKAVQELSICMAFAPEEEAAVLEPFVEKLHLMKLESSWKSLAMQVN